MDDADPTGRWFLHTAWRAGSRRAVVDCISLCLLVRRDLTSVDGQESKAAAWTGEYDPTWYAQQAVALGYISADQATTLLGDDEEAATGVLRMIWDFSTDPAFATGRPDWSFDWPANTPSDQVGPARWLGRFPKVDSDQDHA